MRYLLALGLVAAAGCGKATTMNGNMSGDVDLDVVAGNNISDAQLASVTTLALGASGAAMTLKGTSYTLNRPMNRKEQIIVQLKQASSAVTLSAVAKSKDQIVAIGLAQVSVSPSGAAVATIMLGRQLSDGSLADDAKTAVPVAPLEVSMLTGQTTQLTALGPVTWQVQEGATGGSVDGGVYVAPAAAGTYHAVATSSVFYQQQSAAVTVDVGDKGIAPWINGTTGNGYHDGSGGDARIEVPTAITTDGTYVYFGTNRGVVRRFDPASNSVTTIAGSVLVPRDVDGTGTSATFNPYIGGLIYDGHGNLFAGTGSLVRQIQLSSGAVTTFLGKAGYGRVDGAPAMAQLNNIGAMAFDGASAIYVATNEDCTLRRIDLPSGNVTTVAGPAPGATGPFCGPFMPGTGTSARFCNTVGSGLAYLNGAVYLGDTCATNAAIRRFTVASGAVDTLSPGINHHYPRLEAQGSSLWIVDGALVAVDLAGGAITDMFLPTDGGVFGAAFLGTQAYLFTNDIIWGYDPVAKKLGAPLAGQLQPLPVGPMVPSPWGIKNITLGLDGNLYAGMWRYPQPLAKIDPRHASISGIDVSNMDAAGCCQTLASDGTTIYTDYNSTVASIPVAGGTFTTLVKAPDVANPRLFTLDGAGNLYFAEASTIRKLVLATNTLSVLAGSNAGGGMDGTGAAAQFTWISGITYDGNGTLWVTDGAAVRSVTVPGGVVTTVAGDYLFYDGACTDAMGKSARFLRPGGITIDPTKKYLYVSDSGCDAIRRVTIADGTVLTVAGTPGHAGVMSGPLPGILNDPQTLVFSPLGELIVLMPENNTLMQIRF